MVIAGIDYSLNSPGVCVCRDGSYELYGFNKLKRTKGMTIREGQFYAELIQAEAWNSPQERYHTISETICNFIGDVDTVVFESYAMGISGSLGRIFDLAEGTQTLKSQIYREKTQDIVLATPGQIKKFATGKGNSGKLAMIDGFKRKTGFSLGEKFNEPETSHPFEDMVDAYWAVEWYNEQNN